MGTTLIYARVSTADQDLDAQASNLWDYVVDDLGVPPADVDVLQDKATGTDTDRSGYREFLERVRAGEIERVVVREVTRVGRNFRDIHETVHELVEDHGVGLSITNDNLEIEPGGELSMRDKMFLSMLAWGAELEAKKIQENTVEGLRAAEAAGKWVGRPPYGFTTDDDGYLQPTDEFGNAVDAIRAKVELGWSDRKIARHTGIPRRTVPRILDRCKLYLSEGSDSNVEGRLENHPEHLD